VHYIYIIAQIAEFFKVRGDTARVIRSIYILIRQAGVIIRIVF